MPQEPAEAKELSSWKVIADYLGVSIRTAQALEKECGLPVHRLAGPRGRTTASVAELEEWKRAKARLGTLESPRSESASPQAPPRPLLWPRVWALLGCAGLLLLALGAAGRLMPDGPAVCRVERGGLIVVDSHGRELWRKAFGNPLHSPTYAAHPENYSWIGDLDGDGANEVLFVPVLAQNMVKSTPLVCYSDRGEERWRFVPERRVATTAEQFAPIYGIASIAVAGRPSTIAVASMHYLYYPSQIALISAEGRMLREYWHPGHLKHIRVAEHNGKTELYLAGINNARHAATLIVLDKDNFGGAAQEAPPYDLLGFAPARERQRIILPRSCLSRATDPYNAIFDFWVSNDEITIETIERLEGGAGIIHHLSPDLRQYRFSLSDSYKIAYARARLAREIDHGCTLATPLDRPRAATGVGSSIPTD